MRIINVVPEMDQLQLGKQGENKSTKFLFDVSDWLEKYPGCTITLVNRRPNENSSYPCVLTTEEDGRRGWVINSADLAIDGKGECELKCTLDDMIEKDKRTWKTNIVKSLAGNGDAPAPWESVMDDIEALVGDAQDAAEDAEAAKEAAEEAASIAAHAPIIQDGYWYEWDATTEQYVNTEVKAQGEDGDPGQDATPALITKDYSELTFPVAAGTMCYHSGLLYKANQAIATSEEWTAAHWTQTTIEEEHLSLKTEINSKANASDVTNLAENVSDLKSALNGDGNFIHDYIGGAGVKNISFTGGSDFIRLTKLNLKSGTTYSINIELVESVSVSIYVYLLDKNGDYIGANGSLFSITSGNTTKTKNFTPSNNYEGATFALKCTRDFGIVYAIITAADNLNTQISNLDSKIDAVDDRVDEVKQTVKSMSANEYLELESGKITTSDYALVYESNTQYARLPQNKIAILPPGATVKNVDNTTYTMTLLYAGADGKWYSQNISDGVYIANGDLLFAVSIRRRDWGQITDPSGIEIEITVPVFTDLQHLARGNLLKYNGCFWTSQAYGIAARSTATKISDFIKVSSGDVITYNLRLGNTSNRILIFYDTDRKYVSSIASAGGVTEGTFTAASDGYIRICSANDYADGYVYSQIDIPDKISVQINDLDKRITNGVTGTDYMIAAVDRITGQLYQKSALGNIAVFGFNTDQHIESPTHETKTLPVLRGLRAMSKLTGKYPFDFICLGGDTVGAINTVPGILETVVEVNSELYDAKCPVISITGNHDAAQNNNTVTGGMLFNAHLKHVANTGILGEWDSEHTNCVLDSEAHKIRFIFLDDTTRTDYTSTQRQEALVSMLSGTPQGYKIITLSHHVMSSALADSHWAQPLGYQSILADYADKIICCISGHTHWDGSEKSGGILYISTTCAYAINDIDGNQRMINTENETAQDIFVIDQSGRKIYALRYGYGEDREWTY